MLYLVFLLIIFFYYNFSLSNKVDSLNTNIKNTKTELAKYNKINDEIAQIKKKLNNLKKKMAVMKTLEANRFEPTRLLDVMTQVVVPKRMWFTTLESRGDREAAPLPAPAPNVQARPSPAAVSGGSTMRPSSST